jgi:hypothetical protein
VIGVLLGAALLSGCGTATFTNSFAVAVESRQQVSVFDSSMGDSAEWAGRTMGVAAPGSPYTTQVFATDTKLILDNSPPGSVRVGLFLPQVTQTGYFAIDLPSVSEGAVELDAPFVAWYSEDPVEQLPAQPLGLEIVDGPDGWVITVDVPE